MIKAMLPDLFPFLKRVIPPGRFERSVFDVVTKHVTDKHAMGEELEGTKNLNRLAPDSIERQKMAADLYLLLERNISEEQTRNRVPREVLRERIFRACHPERAEGNFALFFLPHYERQITLFERFTDRALERARDLLGEKGYAELMDLFGADPTLAPALKDGTIIWKKIRAEVASNPPAVQRDMIQNRSQRIFSAIAKQILAATGDVRTELMFKELYQKFHDPITFIEDSAKILLLIPNDFLQEERIGLMGKAELEEQLRRKSQILETTLAEVQGEKLKLSELSREELERKVQERTAELVAALKAAQEARQNLEEFSSLATHELRTPVGAMKGYLNLIKSDKKNLLDMDQRHFIEQAIQANDHLLTLVNAMLDVSRIELGTLAIDPSPVQLTKLADDVLAELEPKFKEKKQEVVKHYDKTIPELNLDPSLMHAIFINLLSNASKYTPDGGTVTLTLEKHNEKVSITVKDTGLGIPKAQQGRIFEKLFRADNARTKIPEGTGLGLYLVKSILDETGGSISFESEENKGSTFYVTVPMMGMKKREGSKGLS